MRRGGAPGSWAEPVTRSGSPLWEEARRRHRRLADHHARLIQGAHRLGRAGARLPRLLLRDGCADHADARVLPAAVRREPGRRVRGVGLSLARSRDGAVPRAVRVDPAQWPLGARRLGAVRDDRLRHRRAGAAGADRLADLSGRSAPCARSARGDARAGCGDREGRPGAAIPDGAAAELATRSSQGCRTISAVKLYYDLASPYAYLAVARAADVLGAEPELKPVLVGAIFGSR